MANTEKNIELFETKIRPVLVENCYKCHSVKAGKSKGGLLLDTKAGIREGGDNGPAVVPGNPAESFLFLAISHAQPDLEMPPKKERMRDQVIAFLENLGLQTMPPPVDHLQNNPGRKFPKL